MSYTGKAIGMYIFGGSATIAHLQCGWNIDKILEMTDDMIYNNSYHFVRNYPNISIKNPSEWNNDAFLNELKSEQYDLLFTNNPCSGLSRINRNANVDQKANNRFYEVFNVVDIIKPKVFLMENAPSLVTIGTPILQDMIKQLGNNYKFSIIRDEAGNHGVPMKRCRTLVIGWNKEYFNNIPIINMKKQNKVTIRDVFNKIDYNNGNNLSEVIDDNWSYLKKYYKYVKTDSSVLRMCAERYIDIAPLLNKNQKNAVLTAKNKLSNNQNIWDKSPYRLNFDKRCGSMTSLTRFIHPTEDRDLYVREYAAIMGYPESFKFYEGCNCNEVQCVAQGVPVNFIKYISNEIIRILNTNYKYMDGEIIYQNHISKDYRLFNNINDFLVLPNLHNYYKITRSSENLVGELNDE